MADAKQEVAQQIGAEGRVPHLGVELHCPDIPHRISNAGDGIVRARGQVEAGRQLQRRVAMRHPDIERRRQAGKQRNLCVH